MVKSHPLPIPANIGAVAREPTQEKMFRMKLFSATPSEDFLGMNSVSMVVTTLKMSTEPMPKKKLAIIYNNKVSDLTLRVYKIIGFSIDILGQARTPHFASPNHTRSELLDIGRRQAMRSRAFDLLTVTTVCLLRRIGLPFLPLGA